MSTMRQIEANRRNSQLSTGPRTPEGKAVSRFNALKSGINAKAQIIPGEDPAELEALTAEYDHQFQPAAALERFLVDALVAADWQLRRLRRVEAELWAHQISLKQKFGSLNEEAPLGNVFDYGRDAFTRLQRRIDSTERSYYRALTQLQRLRSGATPDPDPAPDPQPPGPDPAPAPAPNPPPLAPNSALLPAQPPAPELASFSPVPESALNPASRTARAIASRISVW